MNCCQCQGIESLFDQKKAGQELEAYRKTGPSKTTRILLNALKAPGVEGRSLLDIGGGVGAIQHELASAGVAGIVNVDASTAYLKAARAEAERQGYAGRVSYQYGNFVDLASTIEPADIVTLDRVLCCYHDVASLVSLSAARARQLYGLIYPRDTWWMKLFPPLANAIFRLRGNPFRIFIHSTRMVDTLVRHNGFEQRFHKRAGLWQVIVYHKRQEKK
jgi:magnesium-protoporphyrin O-methyltransferase